MVPENHIIALKLAKAGYCGGDPERILMMRADFVIEALHYETFIHDYETTYYEMNRGES
jgi:hypothetical protein